jgi:hypothetical protein
MFLLSGASTRRHRMQNPESYRSAFAGLRHNAATILKQWRMWMGLIRDTGISLPAVVNANPRPRTA